MPAHMKILSSIVIFNLSSDSGMPIFVGKEDKPEFITSSNMYEQDGFDYKIENLLALHDLSPVASYYKIRLYQACVLT